MVIQSCLASSRCRRKPTQLVNRATNPSSFIHRSISASLEQQQAINFRKSTVIPVVINLIKENFENHLVVPLLPEVKDSDEKVLIEDFRFVDISDQNLGSVSI